MSLQSIGHFQKYIYEILKNNAQLCQNVQGIYLSVQQDAKYPFILINLLELKDVSKYSKKIYEIDYEIAIFSRERSQEPILKIADHVTDLMGLQSAGIAPANLISMKKNSMEWIRGSDGTSNKLVMKYKAMLGG